ncbi:MAG: hypothetical protein JNL60_01265 [Bacteroidia bacterium]|nr:hypothetical protein [Bacteroidia bacterium]
MDGLKNIFLSLLSLFAVMVSGCSHKEDPAKRVKVYSEKREAVLNQLHNEINRVYGFVNGVPRVNSGPCGRFARDFREQWNSMFDQKINIVFAMKPDTSLCYHVLVKLPDGRYYDGGNGVITGAVLHRQFLEGGLWLNEMKNFNYDTLDKWSYSLKRKYKRCTNYSDDTTNRIIRRYLQELTKY